MSEIRITRGDSLVLVLTFQDDDGQAVDLTNAALSGQIRTPAGEMVTALPIVRTDTMNVATTTIADTSGWPVGLLRAGLLMIAGGLRENSDTFAIHVDREVTR